MRNGMQVLGVEGRRRRSRAERPVGLFARVAFVCVFSLKVYAAPPNFGERVDLGLIEYDPIREASGIAASRKNPGVLWTHNDSGDRSCVYALNTRGKHLGIYWIKGVSSRDWEDIALGPGPVDGEQYLYIGDIGDSDAQYDLKYIHRVREPEVDAHQSPLEATISGAETIMFRYPDGKRDAETLMVDPLTRDLYVISKREAHVGVYRAPYPQTTGQTMTLEHVGDLNLMYVVGGDLSSSGREIPVKTYLALYYWPRSLGQSVREALSSPPVTVPYIPEPQGEAVCWAEDGMGYYTISEEFASLPAHLYFYPRLDTTSVGENGEARPSAFLLEQNIPNPFNAITAIRYELPGCGFSSLKIYDIAGQAVRTLVRHKQDEGPHCVIWDGRDDQGRPLSAGVYVYALDIGSNALSHKLLLLR